MPINIPSPVAVVRADQVDGFDPGACNVLVVTSIRWAGGLDGDRMADEARRSAEALVAKFPTAAVWHGKVRGIATEAPHREWETSPFGGIDASATRVHAEEGTQ